MARTNIDAVTQINAMSSRGLASPVTVAADAANGHAVPADGKTFVTFENSNAATRTVTVKMPGKVDVNLQIPDRTLVIPATTGRGGLGPFGPAYTQADGKVWLDFSADPGLTCTYWRLP